MVRLGKAPWIGGFALMLLAVTPAWGAPCAVPATASVAFQRLLDDARCRPDLKPFAHLAWQTFKFLVWPASTVTRGEADEGRSLGDMNGPRVFETLKSQWETFPPNAVAPLPWNDYPATAAMCRNASPIAYPASKLVLGSLHKFGNILLPDLGFVAVLMAQNGKPVRYLAAFDRNEFTLIETKQLYNPANVPPESGEAPTTAKAAAGTLVVKSAWIEMDGMTTHSFHTRTALVQDLDGTCRETTIGLVGLHVMRKTADSPQWIWASFEHVRNVPSPGAAATPGFTFNDASGTAMGEEPPAAAHNPGRPGWSFPPPYNVERLFPIEDDIKSVNADWHTALQGSVWANYELVLVQWPGVAGDESRSGLGEHSRGANGQPIVGANPTPPCTLNSPAEPRNLANSVLEPFGQRDIGCSTDSRRTCMGCHNRARSNDFIFALPNNAPFAGEAVPPNRRSTIEYLRSITGWKPPSDNPR